MNIIRLNSIGEPFAKSGQATPPSGGGTEGGSGSTASDIEYLDFSGDIASSNTEICMTITSLSHSIKMELEDGGNTYTLIETSLQWAQLGRPVAKAVKFSKNEIFTFITGMDGSIPIIQTMTAMEILTFSFGENFVTVFDSIPRITKEQFYTI